MNVFIGDSDIELPSVNVIGPQTNVSNSR